MNNGDLIRQMTDEQLIDFINKHKWCHGRCYETDSECKECVKRYILAELKENE